MRRVRREIATQFFIFIRIMSETVQGLGRKEVSVAERSLCCPANEGSPIRIRPAVECENEVETMEKRSAPIARQIEGRARGVRRASVRGRQAERVRHGFRVDSKTVLPQVAPSGSDLADELLVIEMRLLSAMKYRATQAKEKTHAEVAPNPKAKIVAGLKKKR